MPLYEYQCSACDHADTLLEKISASRKKKCPACNKRGAFIRQISAPAFHLKGDGWYVTDFRDKKSGNGDAKPKDDSAKSDTAKSDTGKAAKTDKPDKPAKADKPAKTDAKKESAPSKAGA